MKNYLIFLKKELIESLKTYKLLIMGVVFLIFGMLSPLTAKFTPELLKWALENETDAAAGEMLAGMLAVMPPPTALDSWAEFCSNIGFAGFIVLIIVFSGMLSSELSKGTLIIILTKGISRMSVLLSKATSAILIWTVSLTAAFFTCLGYTSYWFEETLPHMFLYVFCLWLLGVFLLALTALFAVITKKGYVCMMLVGAVAVVLNIINIIPKIARYNPVSLTSAGLALIMGEAELSDVYPLLIITGVCAVVFIAASVIMFNKRKI